MNNNNLKPWQPGKSGNPSGRPRGSKGWAPIIRKMLYDEQLIDKLVVNQPIWYKSLEHKNMANIIVAAMMIKAAQGDVKSATWLASYSPLVDEDTSQNAPPIALVRFVNSSSGSS